MPLAPLRELMKQKGSCDQIALLFSTFVYIRAQEQQCTHIAKKKSQQHQQLRHKKQLHFCAGATAAARVCCISLRLLLKFAKKQKVD